METVRQEIQIVQLAPSYVLKRFIESAVQPKGAEIR